MNWQIVGFGNFGSVPGQTDMLMRNTTTGGFQVYNIANNQIPARPSWVRSAWIGRSRASARCMAAANNTGAFLAYDISNNQITSAASMGQIAMDWQLGGFAAESTASGASTGDLGQASQLVQAMAVFGGDAAEGYNGVFLGDDTSQQAYLTTRQA